MCDKTKIPKLLTPEEVSERFSLSVRQVRELARRGEIPSRKVGKLWRFPENDLLVWIQGNSQNSSYGEIEEVVNSILRGN
jgi:excisionase family DNA binding protein